MEASGLPPQGAIGFLTVVEDKKHGLFGGYLVLNRAGRPLEFHCTAPVRPNRAQEILYGPTLRPYLFGEQIGRTLLEQGKNSPCVVLTDCEPMLAVSQFATAPVALIPEPEPHQTSTGDSPTEKKWRLDGAQPPNPHLRFLHVGSQRLAVEGDADPSVEASLIERIGDAAFDLIEPFQRIRAAIEEARRGGQ